MADGTFLGQIPETASVDTTDRLLLVRASGQGRLVPVTLIGTDGGGSTGGDTGGGGGTAPSPVTSVFGRIGAIDPAVNDYSANQIAYSNASSGLPATQVQAAIDAVAAQSGTLPAATSETHVLTLDGNLLPAWTPQVMLSFNGRSGAVSFQMGDADASMITDTDDYKIMTAAERTKLGLLDTARQVPDPTGVTSGHVLTAGSDAYAWAAPTPGGGGGGISQIDLLAKAVPLGTAPPNYVYSGGVGIWEFTDGDQTLRGEFRWPGGTPTVKIMYQCNVATSGNVEFFFWVMAVTPGDAEDMNSISFATANASGSQAVPGTVNYMKELSFAPANLDGVATGDLVRWQLKRNASVASNATGGARVRLMDILFA